MCVLMIMTAGLSLSVQQQSVKHGNMHSRDADGNEVRPEIQIKKMGKGMRMILSAKHRHFKSYGFLVTKIHFIQKCAVYCMLVPAHF